MPRVQFGLSGAVVFVVLLPVSRAHAADVTCYVDSVAGDDTKSGLTEADAVASRAKIPTTCTIVKFKRGSVFKVPKGEQLVPTMSGYTSKIRTLTNYGDASLPQPRFIKVREHNNGGMISARSGGLTIDGLYLEGAESDAQMANLAQGICIMAGANTRILNNEITNCDIGIMLSGPGSLVQGNYVHDLHVVVDAPPGVDPNLVGGAEGIFVNASDNEVAFNTFVNCSDYAQWTGGDCDGGATEVTVPGGADATVSNVRIHHNFAYNTCGFFEVSSMGALGTPGKDAGGTAVKGTFSNSIFYNNVIVDSGWLSLLQVNNTDLVNIKWENNTFVQHNPSVNQGIIAIVFTATSSGMSGGSLLPNTVFWTNNFFVFSGVTPQTPDKNFSQTTNLIIKDASKQDPGFVNPKGRTAADYDLVAGSPAIDQATATTDVTLDFLNRAVPDPTSGKPDIGAYEYQSTQVSQPPGFPGAIPTPPPFTGIPTPGSGGAGGTTSMATATGGAGGTTSIATRTGGSTGTASTATGKGDAAGGATSLATSMGGITPASGGTAGSATGGAVQRTAKTGCTCHHGRQPDAGSLTWVVLLGFILLALRPRRGRP